MFTVSTGKDERPGLLQAKRDALAIHGQPVANEITQQVTKTARLGLYRSARVVVDNPRSTLASVWGSGTSDRG